MEPAGNMVLVEGEKEVKRWLRGSKGRVDDWLYELVDSLTFFADRRLRERAPGSISELVGTMPAHQTGPGSFEGMAGVEPDFSEGSFFRGLGSDPSDYPVFVEVGTGIFGPVGQPISSVPGHKMGPIFNPATGSTHYVTVIQGQRPQHYARDSFEDLVEHTTVAIREHLPELGRRTD